MPSLTYSCRKYIVSFWRQFSLVLLGGRTLFWGKFCWVSLEINGLLELWVKLFSTILEGLETILEGKKFRGVFCEFGSFYRYMLHSLWDHNSRKQSSIITHKLMIPTIVKEKWTSTGRAGPWALFSIYFLPDSF